MFFRISAAGRGQDGGISLAVAKLALGNLLRPQSVQLSLSLSLSASLRSQFRLGFLPELAPSGYQEVPTNMELEFCLFMLGVKPAVAFTEKDV